MPILATTTITPRNPEISYNRMALRGSLNVRLIDGKADATSSFALHCTRYRKPRVGDFEVFGLVGSGEVGIVLNADSPHFDLVTRLAVLALDYCGLKGDAELVFNFSWRPEAGDLVGMAHVECALLVDGKRDEKNVLTIATPNTAELAAKDERFAGVFGKFLAEIQAFVLKLEW